MVVGVTPHYYGKIYSLAESLHLTGYITEYTSIELDLIEKIS